MCLTRAILDYDRDMTIPCEKKRKTTNTKTKQKKRKEKLCFLELEGWRTLARKTLVLVIGLGKVNLVEDTAVYRVRVVRYGEVVQGG